MLKLKWMLFALFMINSVYAQSEKIDLSVKNETLKKFISQIETKTDYTFMLDQTIDQSEMITVDARQENLEAILKKAFNGKTISYEIVGKHIILKRLNTKQISQLRKINGIVKDQNGEPIIGANVSVKGTTIGTITDINGHFTLQIPDDALLTVSYIGYIAREIKSGKKTQFDIMLKEDAQTLDEVVVIGFGTQKKVNLTGSVTAVSGKDMTKRPVANAATMLQGQVPGLRVVQGIGQPGDESVTIKVRGVGTFSGAGANPLVLINGVAGDMANIDPSMIESVSVLKDAASAAIYGARAANGVILITTKQGSEGDGKINIGYHGNFASHTPTKMFDLITNSVEYMELFNLAKKNSGESGLYPEAEIEKYRNNSGSIQYPNFDWLDFMFNPAFVQQHNLSLAGNANKTTYNLALNYIDQNGTLKSYNYKKYNLTLDLTTQATKWMKLGVYANLMKGDRKYNGYGQNDAILSTMSQAPTYMPWLPDDGTGIRRWTHKAYNFEANNKNMPLLVEEGKQRHSNNITDVNAQLWMDISLAKGLNWYTKGAVRQFNDREEHWRGAPTQVYYYQGGGKSEMQGELGFSAKESRTFYTNLYTYLKYELSTANRAHNFSAMAGYSQESNEYQTLGAYRRDYPFPLETIDAGLGAPNWSNEGKKEEWALMSGFFRLNYNFKDRYLFEANARYDGSSRLSPEGRWGLFPSFSGAWRLTEENFIKGLELSWLKNAKIRASWGKLGNQEIGLYPYQAMINKVNNYTFNKKDVSSAYFQTAYVNRDLKWETTTVTDIGVDLQLFNNLNITFDWYRKETDGILRGSQISGLLGMDAPTVNNGIMLDKGIELSANWNDFVKSGALAGLTYNVGFYFDRTRNTLKKFGVTEKDGKTIKGEGLPYNSYYMLECIGIFATKEDIDNAPKQFTDNTLPGDLQYRDANGDNVIDNEDRVLINGQYPGFEYGFNASASWKNFDLSILTQGVADKKFYIEPRWGEAPFMQGSAPTKDYVKYMWTEENPYNAKYPRLYFGNLGGSKNQRTNSYFLKNASYLRVKNITIGYTLPKELTRKISIQRLRFYFSGDNLLTFTKFKGLDPERKEDGTATQYPQNRICSFGINIDF